MKQLNLAVDPKLLNRWKDKVNPDQIKKDVKPLIK